MSDSAPARREDAWTAGDQYEPYVGRWSRLVARDFVTWIGTTIDARWLDVGCGTGALTTTILARATPVAVVGIDRSPGYVAHARAHVRDGHAHFVVGDAQALPLPAAAFDVVVSALVLNFVPSPITAVTEMWRVARPGATVAVYVWDYAGQMQLMRHFWDAAGALDPAAADLDEGRRFPICDPEALADVWAGAGFSAIHTRPIDVPTVFRDFDDYWSPFLGGQAPAPGYCMSLSPDRRTALRERVRSGLPFEEDGSIRLVARAWAVKGIVA